MGCCPIWLPSMDRAAHIDANLTQGPILEVRPSPNYQFGQCPRVECAKVGTGLPFEERPPKVVLNVLAINKDHNATFAFVHSATGYE